MPYVNKKRPYKKEYKQQKARGERVARNARERARYEAKNKGKDGKITDVKTIIGVLWLNRLYQ